MNYKRNLALLGMIFFAGGLWAQKWVDTLYHIQETKDIVFGQASDFGGTMRTLKMDICMPQDDTVPPCGRPLMVVVHGGAFLAGDKGSDAPPRIMRDFAKRGYVTASVNYRLGFFQTSSAVNCNISSAGAPWNCLNASDSGEWERALYRGMQDVKGAIRYLINRSDTYQIDKRNVFLVGESAGGFVVLSAAFMDESSEKPVSCGSMAAVAKPNKIYETQCITSPGFAPSVDSLQLQRPDMGSIEGDMNMSSVPYRVRGVGNFFGGMYSDLFSAYHYQQPPVLYMFHQPNDLIVPYRQDRLFAAYAYCATQFPANCQYIINRKTVMGSRAIRDLVSQLGTAGKKVPLVLFDSTLNTADCLAQLANPALAGHAIDNLGLRTQNMAVFFARAMDTSKSCLSSRLRSIGDLPFSVRLYPNPVSSTLHFEAGFMVTSIEIMDISSKSLLIYKPLAFSGQMDLSSLANGIYIVRLSGTEGQVYKTIRK